MLPYLTQVFTNEIRDPTGRTTAESKAPWSWSTDDTALAVALKPLFTQHGLPEELCAVTTCSDEEKDIINECWSELLGRLAESVRRPAPNPSSTKPIVGSAVQLGDETKCHRCQKDSNDVSSPLMKCAGCKKAWYCSQECQKAHWKKHKPECVANRPGKTNGAAPVVDSHKYYNTMAHKSVDAKALAALLNLELPSSASAHEGYMYVFFLIATEMSLTHAHRKPLRRLVLTGKDTATNMHLLFGPNWRKDLLKSYDEVRAEVLLSPPRGSPAYVLAADLDKGAPDWSPRPPSEAEQRNIEEVRKMQSAIRERVGERKSPTNADMQAILMSFGPDWVQYLPLYQIAVNTMDQGV